MLNPHSSQHGNQRNALKVAGFALVMVGGILTLIGLSSFFSAMGSFEPPRYFWCAFLGLPLTAVGASLMRFAFLGSVTRYMANEVAPVGSDLARYMVHQTKGSAKDLAQAVAAGAREGLISQGDSLKDCPLCLTPNSSDARFCKQCGAQFQDKILCRKCGQAAPCDSRFCSDCGTSFA